jgi:hypothetical protein
LVAVLACAFAAAPGGALAAQPYPGTPDPGGDPNAEISVPPPAGKFFGFHDSTELATHGWSESEVAVVAAAAGANVHRFTLDWWNVEPRQDHWDEGWWDRYGRLYDALVERGIRPLITLAGVPMWAVNPAFALCGNRVGCDFPPARWMDDEWAEFTAEVARRFPQAAALEIWNEPNLQGFWKPTPDPWRYAELVSVAYDAIKGARPGMTVLGGALAPTQTAQYDVAGNRSHMPMKEFLDRAYQAQPGLQGHVDGISFHTVFQASDYGAGSLWAKAFADVRDVTAKHGDGGIDLWISETGLTTQGNSSVPAYSEEDQAHGLLRQYRRVMQMPDARGIVVHTLGDRVEVAADDFNRGYGVIRSWSPFQPKIAYCAFAGRVDGAEPYGDCPAPVEPPPVEPSDPGEPAPPGEPGADPGADCPGLHRLLDGLADGLGGLGQLLPPLPRLCPD